MKEYLNNEQPMCLDSSWSSAAEERQEAMMLMNPQSGVDEVTMSHPCESQHSETVTTVDSMESVSQSASRDVAALVINEVGDKDSGIFEHQVLSLNVPSDNQKDKSNVPSENHGEKPKDYDTMHFRKKSVGVLKTESYSALHSMDSLLQSARREAVSLVIHEDDGDTSGIYEHQIPSLSTSLENQKERPKRRDHLNLKTTYAVQDGSMDQSLELHSMESVLLSARREAVSLVIHENDSGIFEHQIPPIDLLSENQNVISKRRDDRAFKKKRVVNDRTKKDSAKVVICNDEDNKCGIFEHWDSASQTLQEYQKENSTRQYKSARKECFEALGWEEENAAADEATGSLSLNAFDEEEGRVLKNEKQTTIEFDDDLTKSFSPTSEREIIRCGAAIPGAFREGGIDSPLEMENSDDDTFTGTATTTQNLQSRSGEILVSAELVSDAYLYGPALCEIVNRESILVQASPIVDQEQPTSFLAYLKKNKKAQICLCFATFVMFSIGVSVVLSMNTNDRFLPSYQNKASDSFRSPSTPPTSSEAPTSENDIIIQDFVETELSSVTIDTLEDEQSAQHRALSWMRNDSKLMKYSSDRLTQRFALATFYFETGGPTRWSRADYWLSEMHECNWFMKQPDGEANCINGTLHHLIMDRNRLGGSIPEELSLLKKLKGLNLGLNSLVGTIPGNVLSGMSQLSRLALYGNMISGTLPTEVGSLKSLEQLEVFTNGLEGVLPSEIGLLTNVRTIYAIQNFFSGQIPSEIGLLGNLESIWLSQNLLSGTIPTEIGNAVSLEELKVTDNMQHGTVPTEIGALITLREFEVQRNALTGKIPSEFGKLTHMKTLNVGNNTISGTIPQKLSEARNLTFLSLYANELTGSIPTEFGYLANMQKLYLDQNILSGTLPSELGLLTNLSEFWAENNKFWGTVPSEMCTMQRVPRMELDCVKINCSCID